ncbi:hypothetical protein VB776_07235 [Arcicella sp. DC2W]|uniref:Uncharacterized protein n=1 Tax=Arcicella gelida TaxID=2984195 RepID=A0ABU5S2J9_9BACT|nr:hypothetical protein [Arcicella sp. DC2W]MEA5402700.1 hypothetical protein [Arcicella sp. DC2W]
MHATYNIKPTEINDSLLKTIKDLFKNEEQLTITVTSEKRPKPTENHQDEAEKAYFSSFGSWEDEVNTEYLIKKIYSARKSRPRDID